MLQVREWDPPLEKRQLNVLVRDVLLMARKPPQHNDLRGLYYQMIDQTLAEIRSRPEVACNLEGADDES